MYSYPYLTGGRAHGCQTSNNNDNRTVLGDNPQGELGRGRIGKCDNIEDFEIKADGEGIYLPSSSPIDIDGVGSENNGRGGRDCPCTSTRFRRRTLKKKTISHGGTGIK